MYWEYVEIESSWCQQSHRNGLESLASLSRGTGLVDGWIEVMPSIRDYGLLRTEPWQFICGGLVKTARMVQHRVEHFFLIEVGEHLSFASKERAAAISAMIVRADSYRQRMV